MKRLTAKRARELLEYDEFSGALRWRLNVGSRARQGRDAGTQCEDGYIRIRVDGEQMLAHRLIWLMHYGVWPTWQIDHKNRRRNDNRICNLQDVASRLNQQNMKKRADNATGFTGVDERTPRRFRAQITHKGKTYACGVFDTPELAHEAYQKAKRTLHENGC